MRNRPYCCVALKEINGDGRLVVTGVRWSESPRRSRRQMLEPCNRGKGKWFLHAIVEWTEEEVWSYIRKHNLPYCCLYDEGFTRIGCIGCPMGATEQREKQFARWPRYEAAYRRARDRAAAKESCRWESGEKMFEWWLSDMNATNEPEDSCPLFE